LDAKAIARLLRLATFADQPGCRIVVDPEGQSERDTAALEIYLPGMSSAEYKRRVSVTLADHEPDVRHWFIGEITEEITE